MVTVDDFQPTVVELEAKRAANHASQVLRRNFEEVCIPGKSVVLLLLLLLCY